MAGLEQANKKPQGKRTCGREGNGYPGRTRSGQRRKQRRQ